MGNEQMQAAIKELQDALVLMAHLEKRQTDRIAQTEEEVDKLVAFRLRTEKEIGKFRRRTEQNSAEITDKLNGLIGYIEGQRPDQGFKQ